MQFGTVTGRFLAAVADRPTDPDVNPDLVPVSGTVRFTPSASSLVSTADSAIVLPAPIVAEFDNEGYLSLNGVRGVSLVATDSTGINPVGFTYTVTFSDLKFDKIPLTYKSFSMSLPANTTVDLSTVTPVGSSNGVTIIAGPKGDPGPAGGTFTYDSDTGLYTTAEAVPIPSTTWASQHLEPLRNTAQPLRAALRNTVAQVATQNDAAPSTVRVVGLGSSVGVGATLPSPDDAPVMQLGTRLGSLLNPLGNVNLQVTNGSVNGSTITAGQQADYAAAKATAGGAPTLAVLVYGMNDGMPEQYHRGQTYPGVYANGKVLVDAIKADGGDVIIFTTPHPHVDIMPDSAWSLGGLAQYPNGSAVPADTAAGSIRTIAVDGTNVQVSYRHLRVNESLRRLAADTGAVLIDVERYWFQAVAAYGTADLFNPGEYAHPNLLGHQQSYGRAIDDFIRSLSRASVEAAPAAPPAGATTVFKSDNRAYVASTTLSGDPQLQIAVAANAHYRVTVHAFYAGSTDGDIRLGLTIPSGSSGSAAVAATGVNAVTHGGDSGTFRRVGLPDTYGLPAGCNGADAAATLTAVVHTGASGSITAAFCQDTSSSNTTTVYADSYMTVERIA